MTNELLAKAAELKIIIDETREGLEGLKCVKEKIREKKEDRNYDDGLYTLVIGNEHDGSGKGAFFDRYMGNSSLLRVIITHVEEQLAEFENEFAQL
ncbi:MAG: hypothetical protein KAJ19_12855 [Gammaproteobacteria bacterium]|nr:hypothetical protein [Gammaproteobacteria bacterium]